MLRDAKGRQVKSLQVTEVRSATVLRGEMVEVMGLRVFGLPDTLDPYNLSWWAYKADTEEELKERGAGIASGVDVLFLTCHLTVLATYATTGTGQDLTRCES